LIESEVAIWIFLSTFFLSDAFKMILENQRENDVDLS